MKQLFIILFLLFSIVECSYGRGRATRYGIVTTEQSVVSSGSTTTLAATGPSIVRVTGTSSQTIQFADATGYPQYKEIMVVNDSTQPVTVNNNSGTEIQPVAAGSYIRYRLTDNGTSAGTWTFLDRDGSTLNLDTDSISGTLPIANGGTNLSAVGNANEILGTNAAANGVEYKSATITATGAANFPQALIAEKSLLLQDPDGGSATITLEAQATQTAAYVAKLPPTIGEPGFVLKSNGVDSLSWEQDTTLDVTGSQDQVLGLNTSGTTVEAKSATITASGSASFPQGVTFEKSILLQDPDGGSATITMEAQASQSAAYVLAFPPNAGINGFTLKTDGNGQLSWEEDVGFSVTGNANETVGLSSDGITPVAKSVTIDGSGNVAGAANINNSGSLTSVGAIKSETSLVIEEPDAGTNTITIQAQASQSSSFVFTLPPNTGNLREVLVSNGDGGLSFEKRSRIYSAYIKFPAGTPSINRQDPVDWIASLTDAANGITVINFTEFIDRLQCAATANDSSPSGVYTILDGFGPSSITVETYNSANNNTDFEFMIICAGELD